MDDMWRRFVAHQNSQNASLVDEAEVGATHVPEPQNTPPAPPMPTTGKAGEKRKSIFDLADPPWALVEVKTNKPTRCSCCNTPIAHQFVMTGSDDRRFVLGSSCVQRCFDAVDDREAADEIKSLAKKSLKLLRRLDEREKRPPSPRQAIMDAKLMLELDKDLGRDRPHPYVGHARSGKTLRDYHAFCLKVGKRQTRAAAAAALTRLWRQKHDG